MTSYRAGADLERAARLYLADNGYYVARSAGSKGVADIIAAKPGEWLLVQCKRDGKLTPRERADLMEIASWVDATPLLAWWQKDGRQARRVVFAVVVSIRPPLYVPWTPDHAMEAS